MNFLRLKLERYASSSPGIIICTEAFAWRDIVGPTNKFGLLRSYNDIEEQLAKFGLSAPKPQSQQVVNNQPTSLYQFYSNSVSARQRLLEAGLVKDASHNFDFSLEHATDEKRLDNDQSIKVQVLDNVTEFTGFEASSFYDNAPPDCSVLHSSVVNSTQTMLEQNYQVQKLWPDNMVHISDLQLNGRGRGENGWISMSGSLEFSLLRRFESQVPSDMIFVQYLMAIAVVRSINDLVSVGHKGPLYIKWPNDIYADSDPDSTESLSYKVNNHKMVKVGGILVNCCHGRKISVIVGTGLNLHNDIPTVSISSLLMKCGLQAHQLNREFILGQILKVFDQIFRKFRIGGFQQFMQEYLANWLHENQIVKLQSNDDEVSACVKGLTDDGFLLAVDVDDHYTQYKLEPDGNRFDIANGLIGRKI